MWNRGTPAALRISCRDCGRSITADARVGRVAIIAPNGVEVDFSAVSGAATVYSKQLRVHRVQLQFQDALMKASGRMLAAHPWGLEGDLDVVWQMPHQPSGMRRHSSTAVWMICQWW